jgi:hypothetical protein
MFHIDATPTFEGSITIVGQGREQTLKVTFKHMEKSKYLELLEKVRDGKMTPADAILKMLDKWDADGELSRKSIARLAEQQPGADWALITSYGEALGVARKGN